MTVAITIAQDGVRHTRSRCDARAIHVAVHGWPQWIQERGHQGGVHNATTCERCAAAAMWAAWRSKAAEMPTTQRTPPALVKGRCNQCATILGPGRTFCDGLCKQLWRTEQQRLERQSTHAQSMSWERQTFIDEEDAQKRRSVVTSREHHESVMKTCMSYARLAEHCATSQLGGVLRQLRAATALHETHMGRPGQSTLAMWADAAADVAWARIRNA